MALTKAVQRKRINSIVNNHTGATPLWGIDAATACIVHVVPDIICGATRASAMHNVIIIHPKNSTKAPRARLSKYIYVSLDALRVPQCTCTKASMRIKSIMNSQVIGHLRDP